MSKALGGDHITLTSVEEAILEQGVTAITQAKKVECLEGRSDLEKETAIEEMVLSKIAGIAKALDGPVVLRAVNPDALVPLILQTAVGKNMAVHGKSSESPTLAALIPLQASISKAAKGDKPQNIEKANVENHHSIEESEKLQKKYKDLYQIDNFIMPDDIQVLIDNNDIGLVLFRLVEVIGQDEIENIGSETLYFIISALNQLDIDPLRNKILLKVLPLKVKKYN